MPKVYHRRYRYRTQFRKLAFGEPYWLASNVATAPAIKLGRASAIGGWAADGSATVTTVADTSVAVVRVPGPFMAQNRTLS